jgi:FkbM family methyltransferase
MLGHRTLKRVVRAIFRRRNYRALKNSLLKYERPFDGLRRYLFQAGRYPVTMPIRTPLGVVRPVTYSHHDMLTVSEVFCREDYECSEQIRTVVDIGSNIGISALYFLTRNSEAFVYLFEPQPVNCQKLLKNLEHFKGRYEFQPIAIALGDGEAEMGFEETGRYGGIGTGHETKIRIPCREVGGVLRGIIEKRGEIDVLKIDTETLEDEILAAIPGDLLRSIKQIFVERSFTENALPLTHDYVQDGPIASFRRRVGV